TQLTLQTPLVNSYIHNTDVTVAGIKGPCNIYPDIIHSWSPQKMSNLKIYITASEAHAWEISQIYVYKTDQVKFRVVLDDVDSPSELKLTFDPNTINPFYTSCVPFDIGEIVTANGIQIGELLWYNNGEPDSSDSSGEYIWHVDATNYPNVDGTALSFSSGTIFSIINGVGKGKLYSSSQYVYAGGPYLTIDSTQLPDNETGLAFEFSTPIGPLNIPKNRLFDILWNLCVTVQDNYMPYEWWITPDTDNTFHIASRRGGD